MLNAFDLFLGSRQEKKEMISDRVIKDLDMETFVRFFFFPLTVSLNKESEKSLAKYMADELVSLKQGTILKDRISLVKELKWKPGSKDIVVKFVKEGFKLNGLLCKRREMLGELDWAREMIFLDEKDTKKFIKINYKILQSYISLTNTVKKMDSQTEFLRELSILGSRVSRSKYYAFAKETTKSLHDFGEAKLLIHYDYFDEVKETLSLRFSPKEKKIREVFNWLWRQGFKKDKSFWGTPSEKTVFFAKALNFLVEKNLPQIETFLSYVNKLEFFLGGLRYMEKAEKAKMNLSFPVFRKDNGFSIKKLCNPCLLFRPWQIIVANDAKFDPEKNVAVITGPNNSGKTVYIKSIGIAFAIAQNGFPIPAQSAHIPEMKNIITHFVSPGDIARGEGMFLDELNRIKELFSEADETSLIIIDEPVRGSSFEDSEEITLRCIEGLIALKAPTFLTTHLHTVAEKTEKWKKTINLKTEISKKSIEIDFKAFTFKIVPGREKSYGINTADKLGLTKEGILKLINQKSKRTVT